MPPSSSLACVGAVWARPGHRVPPACSPSSASHQQITPQNNLGLQIVRARLVVALETGTWTPQLLGFSLTNDDAWVALVAEEAGPEGLGADFSKSSVPFSPPFLASRWSCVPEDCRALPGRLHLLICALALPTSLVFPYSADVEVARF